MLCREHFSQRIDETPGRNSYKLKTCVMDDVTPDLRNYYISHGYLGLYQTDA